MRLIAFYEGVYLPSHEIQDNSNLQFRVKIKRFSEWLERDAELSDFNVETLNQYMAHRLSMVAPATVNTERCALVSLWNYAGDVGLCQYPQARRLMKVDLRKLPVRGYTFSDLTSLLAVANALTGRFRNRTIERSLFWRAYILTAYDTGLQCGELLLLRAADVTETAIRITKPKRVIEAPISHSAAMAIAELKCDPSGLVFGFLSRRSFFEAYEQLREAAGVEGTSKFIRRASCSAIESVSPGRGRVHAKHSQRTSFDNHLRDDRLVAEQPPMLPPRF